MKKLFVSICMFFVFVSVAHADFSVGVRMGSITKASEKGYFNPSLECYMMLGINSTPYSVVSESRDKNGKITKSEKIINPWMFSGPMSFKSIVNDFAGELVYVDYKQDYFNTGLNYDTPYQIQNIHKLDPLPEEKEKFSPNPSSQSKSDGFRIGRFVKVSTKGVAISTYEVTIQEGDGGNKFIDMSISSKDMYEYAIKCTKSGAKVKILYEDLGMFSSFDPFKDTKYRIIGIKIIQ